MIPRYIGISTEESFARLLAPERMRHPERIENVKCFEVVGS